MLHRLTAFEDWYSGIGSSRPFHSAQTLKSQNMHALAVAEVSHQAKLVKVEEGAEMAGPRMWAHNVVATTSIVVLYMHVLIFSRRHKEYPARLRCGM